MRKILVILVGMLVLGLGVLGIAYIMGNEAEAGNDVAFEELNPLTEDMEIIQWYQEFTQNKGVHRLDRGEYTYILVSEGEKPSGGYAVEVKSVTARDDVIKIYAEISSPPADGVVITVITYPSALIRIPYDQREIILAK